mmetsp:Transcript_14967/g.52530  ORF Transcript_14967/g.52530 Transcript_14967/m.52530 type:complete len:260 (-) Transcript_14967:45-824(-)
MGVKTARTKQARRDLKKVHKAIEVCPHCRKKLTDLEGHIQFAHGHICERCGQRFATEGHWRQHMRDRHGLDGKDAAKDDAKKKIERWVKGKKGKGRGKGRDRDKAAEGGAAALFSGGMDEDDEASPTAGAGGLFRHVCEQCGEEAQLPVCLAGQGLTFTCAHVGRRCRSSAPSGGDAAQRATGAPPVAPQPPASAPTMSLFGGSLPSFGMPAPMPTFGSPSAAGFGAAQAAAPMFGVFGAGGAVAAADVPVPDDSDEDL